MISERLHWVAWTAYWGNSMCPRDLGKASCEGCDMLQGLRSFAFDASVRVRGALGGSITIWGVKLPLSGISADMQRIIADGQYELNELEILRKTLEPKDRVLEFGTGIGLLSSFCAKNIGNERVKTFEANPFMAPVIQRTFEINGVSPTLVIGAIGPEYGQIEFHVRRNFWASSSHQGRSVGAVNSITVPVCALDAEIRLMRPTFLLIDIEGGEEQLAGSSHLTGVRKVMAEVHPELIGEEGVRKFTNWLSELGFSMDPDLSKEKELFFSRDPSNDG